MRIKVQKVKNGFIVFIEGPGKQFPNFYDDTLVARSLKELNKIIKDLSGESKT